MGSWDETCGLTGLPIRAGERVYFQLVAENWCRSVPPTGADGYYCPVLYPLLGVYDDYGRIRDIEKNLAFELLDRFLSEVVGVGVEDLVDKGAIEYKLPFEALGKQHALQMGACFFHEGAYSMFAGSMGERQEKSWNKAVRDLDRWVTREQRYHQLLAGGGSKEATPPEKRQNQLLGEECERWLRRYGNEFMQIHLPNHPEDFQALKCFAEFDIAFNQLRRQYLPLVGCQSWRYDLHQQVATWSIGHVGRIEKELAEDGYALTDY